MSSESAVAPTFLDTYIANVAAANPGISPSSIAAIIAFIMQMISTCVPTPTPPALTSGSNLRRIVLYRAMLANGIRPLSSQGRALADSMGEEAGKLAPDDAAAFIGMCQ